MMPNAQYKSEGVGRKSVYIFVCFVVAAIQFGGQAQVISVSFFAFLACWGFVGFNRIKPEDAVVPLVLMLGSVFAFIMHPDFLSFVLRLAREYCVILLYLATRLNIRRVNSPSGWVRATFVFQLICLGFASLQLITILVDRPSFFLPYIIYGNIVGDEISSTESRQTTVPSYWLEYGAQKILTLGEDFKLRPVAFYSEASYLSSVLLICGFFIEALVPLDIKKVRLAYLLSFLGAVVCQSGSGIAMTLLVLGYSEMRRARKNEGLVRGLLVAIIIVILLTVLVGYRLSAVSDYGVEASGFIRLVLPIIRIGELFENGYFFGVPGAALQEVVSPYVGGMLVPLGVDNSIFNLILSYGVGGIILMLFFYKAMGAQVAIFLFSVAQFNGALLSYDKGAMVGFVLCQYYAVRRVRR